MSWEIALYIYLYVYVIDCIVTFAQARHIETPGRNLLSSIIVGLVWPIIYSIQIAGKLRR